jgi:hypothetical protein
MILTFWTNPYTKSIGKTKEFKSKVELLNFFIEKKTKSLVGYAPRTYRGGVRLGNTLETVSGVVIDYDKKSPFKSIEDAINKIPFFCIAYTTKSYKNNEPNQRFHIFVPFNDSYPADRSEELFFKVLGVLGSQGADTSVRDKARFLHFPLVDSIVLADIDTDFIDIDILPAYNNLINTVNRSRHEAILKYVRSIVDNYETINQALLNDVTNYIKNNIHEPDLFLSGKRKSEVTKTIKDCFQHKAQLLNKLIDFPDLTEKQSTQHIDIHSLFLYKEIDFLNFRGLVGRLTREYYEMALYPCPKFAFFAAVATLSTIKHKTFYYEDGQNNLRSCTNTLLFARSGFSKSIYLNLVQKTLGNLGLMHHVSSKLGSGAGGEDLIAEPQRAGSVLFLIDEFAKYIVNLKNDDANYAQKGIKDFLLEILTKTGQTYITTQTRMHKSKYIEDPNVSTFGLGVTKDMSACFSGKEFSEGLVTRFFICQSETKKVRRKPKTEMSESVLRELKELVQSGFYGARVKIFKHEKRLLELANELKTCKDATDRELIAEEISDVEYKIMSLKDAGLSEAVSADIEVFEDRILDAENALCEDKESGKAVVASRIIEHAKRMITAIGSENTGEIIHLCELYFRDLQLAYDILSGSSLNQLADKIISSIDAICGKRDTKGLNLSRLLKERKFLSQHDFKREIMPALELLEAREEIELVKTRGRIFIKI